MEWRAEDEMWLWMFSCQRGCEDNEKLRRQHRSSLADSAPDFTTPPRHSPPRVMHFSKQTISSDLQSSIKNPTVIQTTSPIALKRSAEMGSLLNAHLDQISLCATSISDLDFPSPKQFTTALLGAHDITSLIRDTEIHERALFSIAPPTSTSSGAGISFAPAAPPPPSSRQSLAPAALAKRNNNTGAVAAVLGKDLFLRVRDTSKPGDLDVQTLLEGASRLCAVYPLPGAAQEIERLRARHEQLTNNIAHYEGRVARNAVQLEGMKGSYSSSGGNHEVMEEKGGKETVLLTREELEREEKEVKVLEEKKRGLEERVNEMDKDLGGLMR